MKEFLKEVYGVAWSDMRYLKHTFASVMVMSMVGPILYLIAFGYGLGRGQVVEGVSYIAFIIPGIIALTSLSSSFSSTSSRLSVQKLYYRNLDELVLCPIRDSAVILGKSVLGVVRGLVGCAIILVLGIFMTPDLKITVEFLVTVLVSCFTFSLLGETAALLAKSHQSTSIFNSLVILPMTFLCGTFFSVASLPDWAQAVLYVMPLTYSSTLMRQSVLGWEYSWPFLMVLLAMAIVLMYVNVYILKSRRI